MVQTKTSVEKKSCDFRREEGLLDKDMAREVGAAFDSAPHWEEIQQFWKSWTEALGGSVTQETVALSTALKKYPPYFHQKLAYYVVRQPILAKALLARLGILPVGSSPAQDKELQAELRKKARDVYSAEDLEALARGVIFSYEHSAKMFFSNRFQPLSAAEREQWLAKIGELPSILAAALNDAGLQPAPFLLLVNRLGLTSIGIPRFAELSE